MKILISIILNAGILFALSWFFSPNAAAGLGAGIIVKGGITTYLAGWVILWLLNVTVRPILKLLSLPLFFISWIVSLVINGIVLYLLDYILNTVLQIPEVSYEFAGTINFIIAVAIFTILNMFYTLIFNK